MFNLLVAQCDEKLVRIVVNDNGTVWFSLKDICDYLEIKDIKKVVNRLKPDEVSVTKEHKNPNFSKLVIVNELVFHKILSFFPKPQANELREFMVSDILPDARKFSILYPEKNIEEEVSIRDFLEKDHERHSIKQKSKPETETEEKESDKPQEDKSDISLENFIKALNIKGIKIGRNRLLKKMKRDGFLYRKSEHGRYLPTPKAMNLGIFKMSILTDILSDGRVSSSYTMKVTQQGLQYLINYYFKSREKALNELIATLELTED